MSTKKKIILHGHLKRKYPHPIEVEASTVAEAIQFLKLIPELDPPDGEPYPVTIDGVDHKMALYSETSMTEIHVRPQTGGAGGRGGLMQILLGITLVALAFVFPAGLFGGLISQSSLLLTGGLMVAGGLLQMLMPQPDMGGTTTNEGSRILGGGQNTVRIGTRIPIAYGNNRLSGHYLSFDVDSDSTIVTPDIAEVTPGTPVVTSTVTLPNGAPLQASVFTEVDKTPVQVALVNPIYPGPVASPTNIPVSGWVG